MIFVSSLERDAHEVGPWHFSIFLLLLTLAAPPLITIVEAKEFVKRGVPTVINVKIGKTDFREGSISI